jgi:acetyl esterase/lipase
VKTSTRFLIAGVAAAATTADAVRPVARSGRFAAPSFAFGLVPSELPIPTGVFQLATAALFARSGGTRGGRGKVGVAAYAASAAGLVVVHRRAAAAGAVLEAALVEGLGPGYASGLGSASPAGAGTAAGAGPVTRRRVHLPQATGRKRFRSERGLSYGNAGVRNHLDIWKPADLRADAKAPVLFQVHGGAWMMGQKEGQAEPLMGYLAERGWVCVTANYRLSPRATWPDQIVDVKKALAWTKANIASYGGDPGFVAITGGSAGGHLAALAALTPGDPAFQPGFEDADTSVAAAVPFYGVYDFVNHLGTDRGELEKLLSERVFKTSLAADFEHWAQASPILRVGPDAPPFFVLHGTNDTLVPLRQAQGFVEELRKTSRQPVVYAELTGAQHAFDTFPSVRARAAARAVERFLAVVRSSRPAVTVPS